MNPYQQAVAEMDRHRDNKKGETNMRTTLTKGLRSAATIVGVCVLTMSSTPVGAQGPGWTADSTVVKLVVTYAGGINVRLSPDLSGCVSQSGYGPLYASIYPTHPGIDRMKADLLAAYLSGSPITLYLTDSSCTVGELMLGGW